MKKIKIAMFSFADIDNYGDILFSHVFENEIQKRMSNAVVDFYTPSDCKIEQTNYLGYTKEKIDGNYDALVLAGGEVVHLFDKRTWEPVYEKRGLSILTGKASDVVWDWSSCEKAFKVWLSVGVRPFENQWEKKKIESTIANLDYISVRGILSKKILEKSEYVYFNNKIDITPDLGWIFPTYMRDKKKYKKIYSNYVDSNQEYAIFQFHNITDEEASSIADDILGFQEKYDIQVYLLPVIHLWEDHIYMQKIVDNSNGKIKMLPFNLTTLEIADIILNSEIVLSASLHVAITALAEGIPAAIYNKWNGTKLQDLFGLQMRLNFLIDDYKSIKNVIELLMKEKQEDNFLLNYKDFMQKKLKSTFDELVINMKGNVQKVS